MIKSNLEVVKMWVIACVFLFKIQRSNDITATRTKDVRVIIHGTSRSLLIITFNH
jgi:hypothetical protein